MGRPWVVDPRLVPSAVIALMDPRERAHLIQRYREGPQRVREALEGITEAELDARPPGAGLMDGA